MNGNAKAYLGALCVFVAMVNTLESQPLGKPLENKDAKVVEPGEKGVNPKAATPPETSNWAGYTSQPQAPYKWFWVQLQLTEDEGGQISGKLHTGPIGRGENILTTIKGTRRDKGLRFKEPEVLFMTPPPPGVRWGRDASYVGTFGPYGALLGDWVDPKTKHFGNGQIFLVRMDYHIVIQRQQQEADGVTRSTLSLNGNVLGDVFENTKKLVPAGVYPGRRWYMSPKNNVQSGERRLGTKGDFLLEIARVPKRKNVLITAGDKAKYLGEDVIAGPAIKKGDSLLAPPVLAALRWHFYGTDNAVPLDPLYAIKELNMRIEVRDRPQGTPPLPAMIENAEALPDPLTRPIRLQQMIEAPKK